MGIAAKREGFTLVELLVVIAIIGVLVGLLLPAVQSAREAARRSQCTNNMKQMVLAAQNHESAMKYFPASETPATATTPMRGFMTNLLPYLEQGNLTAMYNDSLPWYDPANAYVAAADLPFLRCPSTADGPKTSTGTENNVTFTSSASDYWLVRNLDSSTYVYQGTSSDPEYRRGMTIVNTQAAEIEDGLSNTIYFVERAAQPDIYVFDKLVDPSVVDSKPAKAALFGPWLSTRLGYEVRGHAADGITAPGPCAVNCSNFKGVYGFHPSLAHVARVDGSVRALHADVNVYVFYDLCTIRGGELVTESDYQ